jgi:hypothetical protein
MSNSTTSVLASGYRRAGRAVGTRSSGSVIRLGWAPGRPLSSQGMRQICPDQQQADTPERVPTDQGITDQISTARF